MAAKLAREADGQVLIWIKQNAEGDILRKLLPEAVEVRGNDKDTVKKSGCLTSPPASSKSSFQKQRYAVTA